MSMEKKVPTGWTKGEQLSVEHRGAMIVIAQANCSFSNREPTSHAHDVAHLSWRQECWKDTTEWLGWWFS